MSSWVTQKFSQIAFEKRELYSPSSIENLPCLELEHIMQQSLRLLGIGNSAEVASQKKRFQEGDVLYGSLRPYFRKVFRPKFDGVCSSDITVLGANEKTDPAFLFYLVASSEFISRASTASNGTKMPRAGWNIIKDFEFRIPDLSNQKHISSVLSAYDDLIELNEKRIKILEEMAKRLYQEWFVKFRFPGHEKVKLVDSGTEYGKVPEGWEVVPIGELADFINGYPFKPKQLGDSGLPIIKIPELRSGILDKTPRNSGEGIKKKYFVNTGDILFSWSATLLVNIWTSGEAILNQHLFKVIPKEKNYNAYTFFTLTKLVEKISTHVVGATMQHLRKGTVENALILLPPTNILSKFEEIASKILDEISLLQKKNQTLNELRDLLIPQLVTGKKELKSKI